MKVPRENRHEINNPMKIRMAFMSAFLVAVSSAALAQEFSGGTRDEQAACRSDFPPVLPDGRSGFGN